MRVLRQQGQHLKEKEGIPIEKPIRPFFQWRGGKRNLLSKIRPHLPASFNSYYEPFLGGGADFLQSADITISNSDYESALHTADKGDLVFLDPPYSRPKATTFINYNADTFKDAEQERLAAVYRELDARGVLLMETNYDTPETRHLYDGFEFIPIKNRTHIANSDNFAQVMIRNYTN